MITKYQRNERNFVWSSCIFHLICTENHLDLRYLQAYDNSRERRSGEFLASKSEGILLKNMDEKTNHLFWRKSIFYRGFHITFDERVPKFVRNFRSSLRTWQFHYVVVNQIMNFETKLWISRRISLGSCEVPR